MNYSPLLELATLCTAVALLYSAALHAVRPGHFVSTIVNHGVVPYVAVRIAAVLITAAQIAIGVATIFLWVRPGVEPRFLAATAISMSVLCVVMAVYLRVVSSRHAAAPCGCFGRGGTAGPAAIARASAFGLGPALLVVDLHSGGFVSVAIAAGIYLAATFTLAGLGGGAAGVRVRADSSAMGADPA